MSKMNVRCSYCKSTNVVGDVYAQWSVETQSWESINEGSYGQCEDCCGECNLEWFECDDNGEPTE